ncbi:hypothetical protein T484DRAFT_1859130, partial [Baffinella frigidus]
VDCVDGRPCLSDRTVRCSDYVHYEESGEVVEFPAAPALIANLVSGRTYFFVVEALDFDLISGRAYFFVVEARNLNILGYYSGGSLPARQVPRGAFDTAPTNLRVTGVLRDTAYLVWEAAPAATHYKIQYRIPAESETWFPTTGGSGEIITTATEYVLSLPLTTDKTYEFRVLARDLFEQQTYEFRVLARDFFEQQVRTGQVEWAGEAEVGTGQVEWAGEAEVASNIVSATPVDKLSATADKPTGDP